MSRSIPKCSALRCKAGGLVLQHRNVSHDAMLCWLAGGVSGLKVLSSQGGRSWLLSNSVILWCPTIMCRAVVGANLPTTFLVVASTGEDPNKGSHREACEVGAHGLAHIPVEVHPAG